MTKTIYVLNPSSRTDTGITEQIGRSLAWLSGPDMPVIKCLTLTDGPKGIANSVDSDRSAPAIFDFIKAHADDADTLAFVIACFSDPGAFSGRELTRKPVIGIGEAGLTMALSVGERIGTIGVSVDKESKTRRFIREVGVQDRFAGHRSLGLNYGDLQYPDRVTDRLIEASTELHNEDGADVIVLAGSGLSQYVAPVRTALGVPVIDPTAAGVMAALAATAWM